MGTTSAGATARLGRTLAVGAAAAALSCGRTEAASGLHQAGLAVGPGAAVATAAAAAGPGCAGHAACAGDFFVDTLAPADCASGGSCSLTVKLVATGAFHINDEYPYRFKAADAAGVKYAGKDPAGPNVFSKGSGDWRKTGEKEGEMAVAFVAESGGPKTISGTFKLSVCSAQNCLLDQRDISATVSVK